MNATDGRPSSTARSHDPRMEPVIVSQDHSVWTCPSVGRLTGPIVHHRLPPHRHPQRRRFAPLYRHAMASKAVELEVGPHTVRISNPDRVYFPARGETKLDLVNYYLSVGDGIVNALRERPCMLHRFPSGVAGEKVHQKRVPNGAPPWLETVRVTFPRYNRHADELCVTELAHVAWAVQMSTVEFHPWNSRRADTEKPDEWRIDLDPMPDCGYDRVRRVAHVAHEILDELGAVGWPKTSGGRGLHIYVRIEPRWGFADVRRAALAFAHEVERRAPDDVTTTWWRKDRDPRLLFVDYNQNARDHTIASAYSVRGNPEGTVSTPIRWSEIDDAEPGDFTIATVPARFAELGDLHAGIDKAVFSIEPLLEWAERDGVEEPPDPE
ncbi:ATP-dependent DNA ligase [Amycolatopsis bullii]|uniref:ATP-dependent DNA ligase n=2 Tax=Pseudonocardiaceae TaxID=2070 RepID=A0ABQ3JVR0_9PSEU|nr:ATP-dependent DNA ligase [Amycolatopsis bullii]